jgi:hypothetical protein
VSVMPDFLQPRAGLRITRSAMTTLWLAGAVGLSSCAHTAPRAFSPPPLTTRAPAAELPAPEIASPPQVAFEPVVYDFPRQTDPGSRFPAPPPARPARPVANIPKPQPAPNETPSAPSLRLSQTLTPEEFRRNTQDLEKYTESVKSLLAKVAGKKLTSDQKDIAERVQTYLTQAEQARDQDLVTAVNLARRADLLAKDLVSRLP